MKKFNLKHLLAFTLLLQAGFTAEAKSMDDLLGLSNAAIVSDKELATMRGRYVDSSKVMYFGVEMISRWHADNTEVSAGLKFESHGGEFNLRPVVNIIETSSSSGVGDHSISGNGINNNSGMTQTIQIAGIDNGVNQDIRLNILGADDALSGSSFFNGVGEANSALQNLAQGGVVSAGAYDNGLSVKIIVPNVGNVTQHLGKGSMGGASLSQMTQLMGSGIAVDNITNLTVKLRDRSELDQNKFFNHLYTRIK